MALDVVGSFYWTKVRLYPGEYSMEILWWWFPWFWCWTEALPFCLIQQSCDGELWLDTWHSRAENKGPSRPRLRSEIRFNEIASSTGRLRPLQGHGLQETRNNVHGWGRVRQRRRSLGWGRTCRQKEGTMWAFCLLPQHLSLPIYWTVL